MHAPLFLTADELHTLTGKSRAAAQIGALKSMRIAHVVNACGKPVVTRAAVEGRNDPPIALQWQPRALRAA